MRVPLRGLEHLVHAVKNDLMDRLDHAEDRVDRLEWVIVTGQASLADQLAIQGRALRHLEARLDRALGTLDDLAAALREERGATGPDGEDGIMVAFVEDTGRGSGRR